MNDSFLPVILITGVLTGFATAGITSEHTDTPPATAPGEPNQAVQNQTTNVLPRVVRPSIIYVTDFRLDPSQIHRNETILGGEGSGLRAGRGPIRSKLSGKNKAPEDNSQALVHTLSDSIVKQLRTKGFRAEPLPGVAASFMPERTGGKLQFESGAANLPKDGWLITGWFETVEEGKPAVEATVGFGQGSGHAIADVAVTDLAHDPAGVILVMGSGNRARKVPGGLVTMNPYVMGAKFVIQRREGMEKDIKNLGNEIARTLVEFIERKPAGS